MPLTVILAILALLAFLIGIVEPQSVRLPRLNWACVGLTFVMIIYLLRT